MKIRTRVGVAVVAGILSIGLAACTNPATQTGAGPTSGAAKLPANCTTAKPTIGVALPNTVNPYYVSMQDSFQTNGAKLGYDVKVAIANDSDSNQLSQI